MQNHILMKVFQLVEYFDISKLLKAHNQTVKTSV